MLQENNDQNGDEGRKVKARSPQGDVPSNSPEHRIGEPGKTLGLRMNKRVWPE
jgi:hypothetical protein